MWIDWQNVQVELKAAGKFQSQKGVTVDPAWNFWMVDQTLWYVSTGRARIDLPQGRVRLKPGMCLWLRPGFEYRLRQTPAQPLGLYTVHFNLLTMDGESRPASAPLPPELLSPPDQEYVALTIERLMGTDIGDYTYVLGEAMTPLAQKQALNLLTALLMELDDTASLEPSVPRREPPHIAHINDIARRIAEDPTQFDSVADMADELRYTPAHFSRLFRKVRAVSPHEALILSRIRHAANMLVETDLPIKEIAERMGYRDVYFFTRQFRQYLRMPPAKYRKNPPKQRP